MRATVSSKSCFGWQWRASPSSAAKNIINQISVLTTWWCLHVELSLVLLEKGVCYDQYVLLTKLLDLALLHFVFQGQTCLLLQVSLDFLLLHSNPLRWNGHFLVLVVEDLVGLQEPCNFSFFSISSWVIDLDYCDIEWFALETNQDHALFLRQHQVQFSSVQLLSHVQLFATPWTATHQASLSITNSQSLLKLMSIESVMPPNHLILCHPLLLPPSIFPSIRVFSNESALLIRWPKYRSVSFKISPSNGHSGLISFRMDWLDLLAVQGTLNKSLLQHHSSKASILQHSAFFIVQLSHPYMTTGKTIALTRQTFVDKETPLLFDMLSKLVITFLPRSKHLLTSWLQSPSTVILEPPKIKVCHCFHCFSIYFPWSDGTRCQMPWFLSFSKCWALSQLFHSLSFSSRGSLVLLHFLP